MIINNKNDMSQTLRNVFTKHLWIFFLVLSYIVYLHSIKKLQINYDKLYQEHVDLQKAEKILLKQQEDLKLKLNNKKDYAFIEITLMQKLGVVPEDSIKICFQNE